MQMTLNELKSGMVLGRDLMHQGMVLLKEGSVISDHLLKTLEKRRVLFVDVDPDSVDESEDIISVVDDCSYREEPEYISERQRIDELFATINEDDEQMPVLKYCILRQLEDRCREQD